MLSTNLQKLILSGRATYNTFCASGSSKNVLNVNNDRFIIITSIHYQSLVRIDSPREDLRPYGNFVSKGELAQILQEANTQLKVYSTKSNNHFTFRDAFNIVPYTDPEDPTVTGFFVNPTNEVVIHTYLIHTPDVAFIYSKIGKLAPTLGPTNDLSIGFAPPFGYGKAGQPGAIENVLFTNQDLDPAQTIQTQGNIGITGGNQSVEQFTTAVTLATRFNENELRLTMSYPLVNIGYVEIFGSPSNISATL